MSVHRTKALFALGFAALTGCEAVAGIQDITLEGANSSFDGAANADGGLDEATSGDEGDSTVSPDTSPDPGSGDGTSIDSGSSTFADAPGDHDGAAVESGSSDVAKGIADAATDTADAGSVEPPPGDSAGQGDAGTVVGPDGGLLMTELIDDMESQTGAIALADGRAGFWFVFDDASDAGALMPPVGGFPSAIIGAIVPPRGTSNFAAHERGSGFPQYAGMGFNLNDMGGTTTKRPYDASAFQGFVFWGRSLDGTMSVRFNVPDVNTDPAGGICSACNDHFGAVRTLTTNWQQFFVFYSQLAQQGFGHPNGRDDGGPTSLDTTQIYGCQVLVTAPTSTTAFDVWIDDISFIRK